jgi:hypothetical protein
MVLRTALLGSVPSGMGSIQALRTPGGGGASRSWEGFGVVGIGWQ